MGSIINDEKKEFVQEFVNSSRELLDDVEPQIIALEKNSNALGEVDSEILNTIFRLFHTLKGSASFVDLQTITSVTHEAETLLDIFRREKITLRSEHVDLLCRTNDFIRNILDTVEKQLDDKGFEDVAHGIVVDLKNTIASISTKDNPAVKPEAAKPKIEMPELPANEAVSEMPPNFEEELKLIITPEMKKRFAQESYELCEEAEMMLLAFERVPDNLELAANAFRALHSLKGNAGFFGFGELEKISHMSENILDGFRNGSVKPDKNRMTAILTAIDFLRNEAKKIDEERKVDMDEMKKAMVLLELLTPTVSENSGVSQKSPEEKDRQQANDVSNEAKAAESEPKAKSDSQSAETASKSASSSVQQFIRIDIEKLDTLLDLVGEMVIAESMVANCPDLKGLQLERFDKAIHHLNKITRDIQEIALAMRMIPLSSTFHKMERLVRDLSNKFNKRIKLEIVGEETEVDKTIIEQISDPLVHIIRNSVDHGLETTEERIRANKSESGLIRLEAKHSAGEVWIIIEDDGRGLNREKIIKKAIERGMIKGDGSDLKDEDVWKIIFEPGFSTADKVSNISGRGVGMDVVKRNIEKLHGRIDIKTRAGNGSMMILRIPLTLAIIDGMEIQVGHARYIIPISSVRQSIKTQAENITLTPGGTEIVNIRGELLSVVRLHELYNIKPRYEKLEEGLLIIVENNEKKCCLFVDELIGQQQIVIKGLSNYLGHVQGVSGCAIMGDGEISLILDIGDLIASVEAKAV